MGSRVFARLTIYGVLGLIALWFFAPTRIQIDPVDNAVDGAKRPSPSEQGWPHLRGRNYDAQSSETALADSWPAEGPPVLWMRAIGQGYSGIIAVGNHAYTQTQTLTEQVVLAMNGDTGATVWTYRYDWPYDPAGMYPGPRATPTWANGRIFFASPDGLIGCLRASDGQPLWLVNVNRKFEGRGTEFGYSCSPVIEDGKVILPVGGPSASVVALNAENGETVWTSGDAPASYCTALPITVNTQRQVVVFLQNELTGFDLFSGKVLWQVPYSNGYDEHSASPLFQEPYLRTMQPFRGGSNLYELINADVANAPYATANAAVPAGFADVSVLERFIRCAGLNKTATEAENRVQLVRHDPLMSNDVASSVLVDGYVYGFDLREIQTNRHRPSRGVFRCMDFKSGEIRWTSDQVGHASIAVADGKLFLLNDRGEVILLRANPERYEELGRAEIFGGEICWTAPSLHNGRLYLRSPTRAACLYVGQRDRMTEHQRTAAVSASSLPRSRKVQLDWLVCAERECPFELPDRHELMHWYIYSLAVFGLAMVFAYGLRIANRHATSIAMKRFFGVALIPLGVAATPLFNIFSHQFVLTWPVVLFAAHQMALSSVRQPSECKKTPGPGGFSLIFLIMTCLVYYYVTRQLSLAPAWYFLATFFAAWPVALPAAKTFRSDRGLAHCVAWNVVAFSVYFWATACLIFWRTSQSFNH